MVFEAEVEPLEGLHFIFPYVGHDLVLDFVVHLRERQKRIIVFQVLNHFLKARLDANADGAGKQHIGSI